MGAEYKPSNKEVPCQWCSEPVMRAHTRGNATCFRCKMNKRGNSRVDGKPYQPHLAYRAGVDLRGDDVFFTEAQRRVAAAEARRKLST